ncbi:hypothetical protein [uncultured Oscillibacter sp.]|uniref:hypothetical protein n=1 Tax=uncultured Oscillibacter sp. TaxID=876091 RepID=UPI0026008252|nr:hypothetical protein [uncultured Oscillibacter sp.]
MEKLPRYYLRLFNSVTDAVALIGEMNFGAARDTLIKGQLWAEELYVLEMEGDLTSEKELEIWLRLEEERTRERILAEQEDPLRLDRSVKAIVETLQEGTVSAEDLERKIRAALAQVVE